MLPRALRVPAPPRRSFVSTVLLSRTWESETLVDLRKEAKKRGLSTKGNKSTLVARIKEHEENSTSSAEPSTRSPASARSTSTIALSPKKTSQAASPGIPLVVRPDDPPANPDFPAIQLPDLSQPPPSAPVQIPYVPDFWNSARPKAEPLVLEPPRLHVVGGSVTHYDGGPTYILEKYQEDASPFTSSEPKKAPDSKGSGLWADFWETLGFPRSFSVRRALSRAGDLAAQAGEEESQTPSRPLTDQEIKGLYILLGIVGGSWLVGGLINRRSTIVADEHDTQNQH